MLILAIEYGADLVWGPETIDRAMIGTTKKVNPRTGCIEWTRVSTNNKPPGQESIPDKEAVIYRIDPKREAGRLIYQIGTSSPTLAVAAATLVAPYVSGIDCNAGCPKPFSTSGGMGAALLRTPDHLCNILKALVDEVGKPFDISISVKIRLLETPELTSELVNKLCKTGITGLTIHCRTTPMRPRERAIREQLRMIGDICRSHGVACLMNGDVASREEGFRLAKEYGVDGAMIATAAEANSSVFRTKEEGGPLAWREVVRDYLQLAMSVENKYGNTKFLLSQLMPGKDPAYQKTQMSRSYHELMTVLDISDPSLIQNAKDLDHLLGLDIPRITKRDVKREKKQHSRENNERKDAYKRSLDQENNKHKSIDQDPERTKRQKGEIVTENVRFEEVGQGAVAVTV